MPAAEARPIHNYIEYWIFKKISIKLKQESKMAPHLAHEYQGDKGRALMQFVLGLSWQLKKKHEILLEMVSAGSASYKSARRTVAACASCSLQRRGHAHFSFTLAPHRS